MNSVSNRLKDRLVSLAEMADRSIEWPADSWQTLHESGALGWSIPISLGGDELGPVDRLHGMEQIAQCCLTTALIFSQHEAAVRQLLKYDCQNRWLTQLSISKNPLTVGLSQLTTSRQHAGPALRATPLGAGRFRLDGEIPWVTSADHAVAFIAGATQADFAQVLVVLSTDLPGICIEPPLDLSSLRGSRTSLIRCDGVIIDSDCLLAGPVENVLGKIAGGGLDTSCLAIGLAAAAVELIQSESRSRPELSAIANRFDDSISRTRQILYSLASGEQNAEGILNLRLESTSLALRATQASLMAAKGAGFIAPHPAQRWSRQALFFLVWSCPRSVAEGVMAELVRE